MTGTALAVTTPSYQWYAILLVMLVVLDGHPEWLAFAAGGYLAAEPAMGRFTVPHPRAAGYGAAALFVAVVWVARQVRARRGRPAAIPAAASGPWPAPALTSPASPAAPATVTSVLAAEEQVINAPVLQSMIPATTQK
jgi:hypothetical protein